MAKKNLTVTKKSDGRYVAKYGNRYMDVYGPTLEIATKRAKEFFNIKD